MASLILVTISIVLLALVASVSIDNIPASAILRQMFYKETSAGLRLIQNATIRYFEAHKDAEGIVIYPGSGVDMAGEIAPAYGFMPADVRNAFTWETQSSYLYGHPAVYICVKPKVLTAEGSEVLRLIKATLPVQSAHLGSTCGATSDIAGGTHLSVWMILAHYNGAPPPPLLGPAEAAPEASAPEQ